MELQTNGNQEIISLKKKTKILNVVLAIALIIIPVGIAVLMNVQGVLGTLKMHIGEIGRGIVIGVTTLPVMIYIGIKTEGKWYTKVWAWVVLMLMLVGILAVVFFMNKGASSMPIPSAAPSGMPPLG